MIMKIKKILKINRYKRKNNEDEKRIKMKQTNEFSFQLQKIICK